jgi:hypothetical protein
VNGSVVFQGRYASGCDTIAGTVIDGPAAEMSIMTRSGTVLRAAAVQTSPRG